VVASLPFAPEIVLPVLGWFDDVKLRAADPYGFKSSFNPTYQERSDQSPGWASPWHFGINLGPIVLMIENYRTGLLWRLMRHCAYLVSGLRGAGFQGGWLEAPPRAGPLARPCLCSPGPDRAGRGPETEETITYGGSDERLESTGDPATCG
jgi:hypothetical protein